MSSNESTNDNERFAELLSRVRQGEEEAARELVERYERAVLRGVRARLGGQMRSVFDSMDIVQSVHRSLLMGLRDAKYEFSSPKDLIALAIVMVQRKVARHWRKLKHLPASRLQRAADENESPVERVVDPSPTVSRVASANELLNQFLTSLDTFDRQLVDLKLSGHNSVETARLLNREPAFIRLRWTRLRKTLRELGYTGADEH